MKSAGAVVLFALALGTLVFGEEPEIGWNKSFINARREAAQTGCPLLILFQDRIQLDYYDDVLAKDDKVRAVQKGVVWCKLNRDDEPELAKKFGIKAPWEVRIVAPDLSLLKSLGGKPKPAELAAAVKALQKVWTARGGPKSIEWLFSYEEALKLAVEKNRPLLIYFWSDQKKGTNPDENPLIKNDRVIQLAKRFVCIKLNQSVDQELFDKFKVTEVPHILFVKPNEEPYQAQDFDLKVEVLLQAMKDVVKEYAEDTVESGKGEEGKKEGEKKDEGKEKK